MPKTQVHQFETIKKRSLRSKPRPTKPLPKSVSSTLVCHASAEKISGKKLLAEDTAFLTRMNRTPKASTPGAKLARKPTNKKSPKFGDLPLAERRKKAAAFVAEIRQGWQGHPRIDAVDFLVKMRRGK